MLLLAVPTALLAAAPPEIAGEWQGKLTVDPTTSLTVRFNFTRGANGAYTGVLNSPDNAAVKDTPVSGVNWDGTNLKFSVPTLQGAYAGKLADGKIAGEWTQPGSKFPLELAPYQKPVLTAAMAQGLTGPWNGAAEIPGAGKLTFVYEFKQGADGALTGTFGIPEQGQNMPATDIVFENGELSVKAGQGRIEFRGRQNGDRIVGKLKVPSPAVPPEGLDLTLQRGAYQAKPVALKLDSATFATLKGTWRGTLAVPASAQTNNQPVNLPLVVRFETNDRNEYLGFFDSPAQGARGVVISEVTVNGGRVHIRLGQQPVEFNGTLSGKTMKGELTQGAQRVPLELTQTP